MKKQPKLELVTIGSTSISALSETEQKHFYMTLLAQILKLYKEKKQKENQCTPKRVYLRQTVKVKIRKVKERLDKTRRTQYRFAKTKTK